MYEPVGTGATIDDDDDHGIFVADADADDANNADNTDFTGGVGTNSPPSSSTDSERKLFCNSRKLFFFLRPKIIKDYFSLGGVGIWGNRKI